MTLLESAPRLGGVIQTERTGGLVMECGPDVILASKPAAVELAHHVGVGDRLHGTNPAAKGSYIARGNRLLRIPDGLTGLVPSRLWPFVTTPLLSPFAKLRVALDYVIPAARGDADESVEQFVVRRLGREMYDRLLQPLLSGISAGDGSRLSMEAMFPHLRAFEREHGGLIRGMLAARRRGTDRPRGTPDAWDGGASPRPSDARSAAAAARPSAGIGFLSLPNGLGQLVDAVEREVRRRDPSGARLTMRVSVSALRAEHAAVTDGARSASATGPGFSLALSDGTTLIAGAVIVAVPAFAAARLVRPLDNELASCLAEIEYAPSVTVSVAYPVAAVPRALDATGYIVPSGARKPVLACTWTSSKFTGRAPAGTALFRVFLGGAGRARVDDASDDALRDIVRRELRDMMGITTDPVHTLITRYERAMPQYNVGHLARIARIDALAARIPGLTLAGAAYRGVGIPDCVRSGVRAAEEALRTVAAAGPAPSGRAP